MRLVQMNSLFQVDSEFVKGSENGERRRKPWIRSSWLPSALRNPYSGIDPFTAAQVRSGPSDGFIRHSTFDLRSRLLAPTSCGVSVRPDARRIPSPDRPLSPGSLKEVEEIPDAILVPIGPEDRPLRVAAAPRSADRRRGLSCNLGLQSATIRPAIWPGSGIRHEGERSLQLASASGGRSRLANLRPWRVKPLPSRGDMVVNRVVV
jgi:hypothetical protein